MPFSTALAGVPAYTPQESPAFADARVQAIFELGRALGGSFDIDEILNLGMQRISEVLDAERSTLFLLDESRNEIWSRVAQGTGRVEIRLPLGTGIAGHVASTGETVRVDDAYADPRFHADVDRSTGFRTRSILAVPLQRGDGKRLGVAQVLNKRGGPFGSEDETALSALANVIAVALENARLYGDVVAKNAALESTEAQLRQKVAEVDLLLDIEREISSADDRSHMVEAILARAMATVGADCGAVLLHGEPMHELHLKCRASRLVVRALRPTEWSGRLAAEVAAGRPVTAEGEVAASCSLAAFGGEAPRSVLLVPLATQGVGTRPRGVLELSNHGPEPFHADGLKIARLVAAQLARAVSLAGARAETERASRFAALGQMLGSIVHDLRSPMTVISGYSELMAREPMRELREKYASEILSQFDHIESMTRELLAFVRGERRLLARRVELPKFWRELDGVLATELSERGITVAIDQRYAGAVQVDDAKLKRLVANLARNAAQAMGTGGRFDIRVSRDGATLSLAFTDTGPGLPPDVSSRLFSAFSSRGKADGTGLGLAIVKEIVDAHGGSIACDSTPGEGTSFTVELPNAICD